MDTAMCVFMGLLFTVVRHVESSNDVKNQLDLAYPLSKLQPITDVFYTFTTAPKLLTIDLSGKYSILTHQTMYALSTTTPPPTTTTITTSVLPYTETKTTSPPSSQSSSSPTSQHNKTTASTHSLSNSSITHMSITSRSEDGGVSSQGTLLLIPLILTCVGIIVIAILITVIVCLIKTRRQNVRLPGGNNGPHTPGEQTIPTHHDIEDGICRELYDEANQSPIYFNTLSIDMTGSPYDQLENGGTDHSYEALGPKFKVTKNDSGSTDTYAMLDHRIEDNSKYTTLNDLVEDSNDIYINQ